MDLKALNDDQLIQETHRVIKIESIATVAVIRRFREIFLRELYLERGFTSLFHMATEEFGYKNASAQRRINAMELMIASPIVERKLETDELCLQSAADIQTFLNLEAKLKSPYSALQITELVMVCAGQSVASVRRELASRNPVLKFRETKRAIGKDRFEIKYSISAELDSKHARLKQIWSHTDPSMTHEALVEKMTELALSAVDPIRRLQRAEKIKVQSKKAATPPQRGSSAAFCSRQRKADQGHVEQTRTETSKIEFEELVINNVGEIQLAVDFKSLVEADSFPSAEMEKPSRYIAAAARREMFRRHDGLGCTFVSKTTGRRCGSTHFAQLDHIQEWSLGGTNEPSNLRFYCSGHNRWRWRNKDKSVVRAARAPYASSAQKQVAILRT